MIILAKQAICAANSYGLAIFLLLAERARCQAFERLAVDLKFYIRHNMSLKFEFEREHRLLIFYKIADFFQEPREVGS